MTRTSFALLAALSASLFACSKRGFECGAPAPDDPEVIRRCDRPQEICVCVTRACARPAPLVGDAGCASGYIYTEAPFADPSFADQCVPKEIVGYHISSEQVGQACPPYEAGMPDSGPATDMDAGVATDSSRDEVDAGEDAQ